MPQMLAIAFTNVARTSPTLPPSAINTSAMTGLSASAGQDHPDVVEDRGDRRVRLVHGDLERADAGECGQNGVGNRPGRALQQLVIGVFEGRGRGRHHVGIGHGVGQAVRARGIREIGGQLQINHEALPDLGLMFHHAVTRVDDDPGNEDGIGHLKSSIAAATLSACTVSDTSWVRMIRAPALAAKRCAAIEPPRRRSGSEGVTVLMNFLREAPTRSGRPKLRNWSSRASTIMLCSGVLPKPMPGSSTIWVSGMPALAAISSERAKNAAISCMISMPASALSRLCITITAAPCRAIVLPMSGSRCSPQTSFAITAPRPSAQATTSDFMLSRETGVPSATTAANIGCSLCNSSSAEIGCAP